MTLSLNFIIWSSVLYLMPQKNCMHTREKESPGKKIETTLLLF